jgi:phosphatidylglycerophosphate synthase
MDLTDLHSKKEFKGDRKELVHFLVPYEKKFLEFAVPRMPQPLGTAQLTLMTILWSSGIILSGYMAQQNVLWLCVFSFCIFMQYITDMLDGAVGRARNTGLIKWGFYMDHFLDYVFLSSIVIGYAWLLPASSVIWAVACLAITGGFMVHVLMDFAITNNFKISVSYFGVSELRWVLIIANVFIMLFGQQLVAQVLPFVTVGAFTALCVMVYKCQKVYGHIDTLRQAVEEKTLLNNNVVSLQGEKYETHASKSI